MSDLLIDDEFKSDKFSVSLNELLFSRPYRPNVKSVSKLLDDNGYFGRYRIEPIYDKKFRADSTIKIHVYLVDSGYTYTWPYNTFFDLDKKAFGHNRKIPRGVFTDKFMFGYCVRVLSVMSTPIEMIEQPMSYYDALCLKCMSIIKEGSHSAEDWSWIICKNHGSFGQKPYYDRVIPFLIRLGLIMNNKFRIIGHEDPEEYTSNMFDIDYWHNI
jgi:hypothetical protein